MSTAVISIDDLAGASPATPELRQADAALDIEPAQLATAFAAFSSSAESLERSYLSLGKEVCRLRRELEQERDLRRRREALAEISALLAHEIRNPLASMELFACLLAESAIGPQASGWLDQIRSGLRILSATVNNILEFYNQRPLDLAVADLNGIVRSVESLLAPVAARAHMQWISKPSPEPLWIQADRHRLQQVFLNLALNAFRFAAQGGVLHVRTQRNAVWVTVTFEDKGPGIPPELQGRIFDARVSTRPGGTGLGLAVAKRIVHQHGGKIEASSMPERGTCIQVHFPRAIPRTEPCP